MNCDHDKRRISRFDENRLQTRGRSLGKSVFSFGKLEAPPGFEPGMEVLQTSALPLGDGADRSAVVILARDRSVPRLPRVSLRLSTGSLRTSVACSGLP